LKSANAYIFRSSHFLRRNACRGAVGFAIGRARGKRRAAALKAQGQGTAE